MLPTRVPYVLTIAPGLHFHIGAVTSGQRFVDVLHGHAIVTSWKSLLLMSDWQTKAKRKIIQIGCHKVIRTFGQRRISVHLPFVSRGFISEVASNALSKRIED